MVLISRFSFEENCVNIWMILDGMYIRHLLGVGYYIWKCVI